MPTEGNIIIKGAKVNNLKDITLEIPRNRFVVITGISGSGKSSLAFDTLFAEGQRRFAESLSSYARQFLGRMSKPDVEQIEGIPPAIAIQQKLAGLIRPSAGRKSMPIRSRMSSRPSSMVLPRPSTSFRTSVGRSAATGWK